jgi:hypothetical protein
MRSCDRDKVIAMRRTVVVKVCRLFWCGRVIATRWSRWGEQWSWRCVGCFDAVVWSRRGEVVTNVHSLLRCGENIARSQIWRESQISRQNFEALKTCTLICSAHMCVCTLICVATVCWLSKFNALSWAPPIVVLKKLHRAVERRNLAKLTFGRHFRFFSIQSPQTSNFRRHLRLST